MYAADIVLSGVSPLSYSRYLVKDKQPNESEDQYDARIARTKAHVDDSGACIFPGIWIKKALASTAVFLGEKIPGKRNATFSKHFIAGLVCPDDAILHDKNGKPIKIDSVKLDAFPCSSTGGKGGAGGQTVLRRFPMIPPGWQVSMRIEIVDQIITEEVFRRTLEECGIINGVGRFRPQNGGGNGRFKVTKFKWIKC